MKRKTERLKDKCICVKSRLINSILSTGGKITKVNLFREERKILTIKDEYTVYFFYLIKACKGWRWVRWQSIRFPV